MSREKKVIQRHIIENKIFIHINQQEEPVGCGKDSTSSAKN